MCHTQQLDPSATMAPGNMVPAAGGALSGPISDITGPMSVPGPAKMKDTKFGKLLKVVMPIAQGGLIGGFGGNWRQPGSGNAAAQNFFLSRANLAMQKQYLANQSKQEAFLNALRASEMERNNFYENYLQARTAEQQHAANAPYKGSSQSENWKPSTQYPGYEIESRTGQMRRMMQPPPDAESGAPGQGSNIIGGGSNVTASGPKLGIPMGPPQSEIDKEAKLKQPKPTAEVDTDAKGVSRTKFIDTNPNSPTYMQEIKGNVSQRFPKPSESERSGTQVTAADKSQIEQAAEMALQASGNDPDKAAAAITASKKIPGQFKALVRQRAREIATKKNKSKFDFGSVNLKHVGPTE